MKKNLVLILGISSLFALILTFREGNPLYIPPQSPQQTQDVQSIETESQQEQGVVLAIDSGEGEPLVFTQNFEEGETAYSFLENIAQRNSVTIETKQYDFGVFVSSINELESTQEMAWIYFVNGESGQVAADQHDLQPGDVVEWKYTTPSENDQ